VSSAQEAIAAFELLAKGLDAVGRLSPADLPGGLELTGLCRLLDAETKIRALQPRWLAVVDARETTVAEFGRTTRSWLVEEEHLGPGEASRRMRLSRCLPLHGATEAAATAAEITLEHAHTIVVALADVPPEFQPQVESALLDIARDAPPVEVARAVEQVRVALGVDDADAAFERQFAQRGVTVAETFGGTGSLAGTLTPEVRSTLNQALQAAGAHADRRDPADKRTPAQARHDALGAIAAFYLAHADAAELNGERPRVVVTIDYQTLLGQLERKLPTLDTGAAISPATARRLACDAELLPAVLGSRSEPLDVGTSTRAWPAAIRRAAWLRDEGRCTYKGCRRHPRELHHIVWWSRGGPTSLDNAAWLCTFHHWLVHEGRWTLRRRSSGDLAFSPPAERHTEAA
jgi:hypothetical protein